MEKSKSAVWAFFKICEDDEKKAECTLCPDETTPSLKKIIRGKTRKSYSTTPLWNHLDGKHPHIFAGVKSKKEKCVNVIESVNGRSNASAVNKTLQKKGSLVQPALEAARKKNQMWSLDDSRSKELSRKICEMMALDAEPYSLVDREGFNRLIRHLAPQYPMPVRTYFSQKAMPEICQKLNGKIREKLSAAEHISVTSTIWTGSTNESFIILTAHCLSTEQIERGIFVLRVKHFSNNKSHTEGNITEVLSSVLEEWDISSDKVHVIVTENAANMIADANLTRVERVGCFNQSLHLVVHDAIFEQKYIVDILEKCRKIVDHFNNSGLACTKLRKIQTNLKVPIQKLIQDVPTRWDSTFHMISQLHQQKQAVTAYATACDIPTLTAHQWSTVERLIRVLKPFEEITKQAISDNKTIAYVIPAVATLNSYLMKRQKDSRIHALKSELQKSLNKRFLGSTEWNIQERQCFVIATLLDPRYKARFLQNLDKAENWVIDELIEARQKSILEEGKTSQKETTEASAILPEVQSCSIAEEADEDIWKCFEEIANGCKTEIDYSLDSNDSSERYYTENFERQINDRSEEMAAIYRSELEEYLAMPLLPREADPLLWWRQHAAQYPNMRKLVIKYLSSPPVSVNSGRLFNASASIHSENRNRLSPENTEKLLFIMKNIQIVNFMY